MRKPFPNCFLNLNLSLYFIFFLFTFIQLPSQVKGQKRMKWEIYTQTGQYISKIRTSFIQINGKEVWYKKGGKYGLNDLAQNTIIRPKYKYQPGFFPQGLTSVGIDGCWSIVRNGKEILPFKFDYSFIVDSNGTIQAREGCSSEKEAYIIYTHKIFDLEGNLLNSSRCEFSNDSEKKREINPIANSYFEKVISQQRSKGYEIKKILEGYKLFYIYDISLKGILNKQDSIVFSCDTCRISDFHNGFFRIGSYNIFNDSYFLIDTNGIKVSNYFDRIFFDKNSNYFIYRTGKDWKYFLDPKNIHYLISDSEIEKILPLENNLFLLCKDYYSGAAIIDGNGKFVISPKKGISYQYINPQYLIKSDSVCNSIIRIDSGYSSWSYENISLIHQFDYKKIFTKAVNVGSGCLVQQNLLDSDGCRFAAIDVEATSFDYLLIKNKMYGVFSLKTYKEIIPTIYDNIYRLNESQFIVRKANKWGVIDNENKIIVPVKYKHIKVFDEYFSGGL